MRIWIRDMAAGLALLSFMTTALMLSQVAGAALGAS